MVSLSLRMDSGCVGGVSFLSPGERQNSPLCFVPFGFREQDRTAWYVIQRENPRL
ncbi:hypothetical protein EI42_04783 [Thermosporothrix hazakensis]|uniref:Uncharacterized protein n=1 Tax=Thermosporothrix hazakensis TaxID=644383 RepID=A0A326U4E3_THEHA|nr:hypothetical protein EI42_04783 [Thermosporothrix hazakensis]